MRPGLRALVVVASTACVAREDAPTAISDAWCRHLQACDAALVTAAYGDVETCRSVQRLGMRNLDAAALARDCAYDGGVVGTCTQAIRAEPCATFEPEAAWLRCAEAYRCDDGGASLVPPASVPAEN